MKFYYSRKQSVVGGFRYLLDNDGRWKRFTEIIEGGYPSHEDAVCVYDSPYYPLIKLCTTIGTMYIRPDREIKYISEEEIQDKLNVLMENIDKSLIENDKERFQKLSKKYAQLKQQQ